MKKTVLASMALAAALFTGQSFAADTPTTAPEGMHAQGDHHHGRGPGHLFEEADSNHDGVVTKAEFEAQADKMFAKLDTNGDGKITQDERDAMKKKWEAKRAEFKAKHEAKEQAGGDKAE